MKKFIEKVTDFIVMIFPLLMVLAILAVCLFVSKVMFEAIVNSNMPDWLKYILLKG